MSKIARASIFHVAPGEVVCNANQLSKNNLRDFRRSPESVRSGRAAGRTQTTHPTDGVASAGDGQFGCDTALPVHGLANAPVVSRSNGRIGKRCPPARPAKRKKDVQEDRVEIRILLERRRGEHCQNGTNFVRLWDYARRVARQERPPAHACVAMSAACGLATAKLVPERLDLTKH